MIKPFEITYNIHEIAIAFNLEDNDILDILKDPGANHKFIEKSIIKKIAGAPAEKLDPFDVITDDGLKVEIRCLTQRGVYFGSQAWNGSKWPFSESKFIEKLDAIDGYFIADITLLPNVIVIFISTEQVKNWWETGKLNTRARISHKKFIQLSTYV